MIPITDAEWQSLLSEHEKSDNFVIDVIQSLLNRCPEESSGQMNQDLEGE